jgi:hypothetical protein
VAKARHGVILDAIRERLAKGRLTERERELVLTFYEELRYKLHDGAIRRGSFHPGERLQLVLRKVLTCSPKSLPGIIWKAPQRGQKGAFRMRKTKFTEEQMMDAVKQLKAGRPAKDLALRQRAAIHEPALRRLK